MIEVEKKFQPTKERLRTLLLGAEFLGEKENIDIYYDTPDFSYFRKGMKFRKRNDEYELKVLISDPGKYTEDQYREITDEHDILEALGFPKDSNLGQIIREKMKILCTIKTQRKKYKMGEFSIDVDETDFGYNMIEIELMVNNESEIPGAERKIASLGKELDTSGEKLPGKVTECLRVTRPEVYKELCEK